VLLWKKKWKLQNELEAATLEAKLSVATQSVGVVALAEDTESEVLQKKLLMQEERSLRLEKIQTELLRTQKLRAKVEKELADGTVEREVEARNNLLDGQLSGKYSLTAGKHVIGYCETLNTTTSASNSSGANKSMWSGSGASAKTRASSKTSRESELELEVKLLQREVVALKEEIGVKGNAPVKGKKLSKAAYEAYWNELEASAY